MFRLSWCGSAACSPERGESTWRSVREFFEDLFSNPAYQPLDLTADHVYAADLLVFARDSFDALIVAAAQSMGLPLVTRDGAIRDSGAVAIVW